MVYVEGAYNSRLPYLTEVPKGKVVYLFENTDMENAKKALKDTACIAGNVPNVHADLWGYARSRRYTASGLIDTCAPGGGYMMDTSACWTRPKPKMYGDV